MQYGSMRFTMRTLLESFRAGYTSLYYEVCDALAASHLAEASPPRMHNVPSSGVDALFMALQICEQVHMYGFGVDAPRDAPSHYFKEEKLYGIDITTQAWGHDYQMQANFLKVLHVAGFLTICCPAHPEDAPGECFQ